LERHEEFDMVRFVSSFIGRQEGLEEFVTRTYNNLSKREPENQTDGKDETFEEYSLVGCRLEKTGGFGGTCRLHFQGRKVSNKSANA
jgi:hypothetical protein